MPASFSRPTPSGIAGKARSYVDDYFQTLGLARADCFGIGTTQKR